MKVIKKNQIIFVLIAMCLIVVAYVNYTNNVDNMNNSISSDIRNYTEGMGDAKLVSSTAVEEAQLNEIDENAIENKVVEEIIPEEDYFTESKLERNNVYSQTIEIYEKMLESGTITNEQKAIAQNEIQKITNSKNTILIVENLLKVKGFEDSVVFENNGSVSVIVKSEEITPEQVAQIQNIVSREFSIETENISITNK